MPRCARDLRCVLRCFGSTENATSAVEFAIIFPVMLILMLMGLQLITYINATRKVELIANSISQMISEAVPPNNSTTATVASSDIHFSYDSSLVLYPYLMKDGPRNGLAWWQDILIDYAGIQFTKIASNCTNPNDQSACYTANVVWTSTGTYGSNYRPCLIPQLPANNNASPSPSTLPRSLYGPSSMIVIDVVFTYRPTFASKLIGTIRIARSVYVQPRYALLITYNTTNNDGIAIECPGY